MVTTPFEDTGNFTALATEQTWWADLAANNARVTFEQVGESVQSRPIDLVCVADPTPPAGMEERQSRKPLLFITLLHGDEVAGREACMALARDLAETTDPALVDLLERRMVAFMPNVNPDGYAASQRNNANNVDLNRENLRLEQPEAQVVQTVIRDLRPYFVADMHEDTDSRVAEMAFLGPDHPQISTPLLTRTDELIDNYLFPAMDALGITSERFWRAGTTFRTLRLVAGGRHALACLTESHRNKSTPAVRVQAQSVFIHETLQYIIDNEAAVDAAVENSRVDKRAEGTLATVPFQFLGGEQTADPPPVGYRLTPAQRATVSVNLDVLAIRDYPIVGSNDRYVPMGQEAQPLIPHLLDSRAADNSVAATALFAAPALSLPQGIVRDGAAFPVDRWVKRDGFLRPVGT